MEYPIMELWFHNGLVTVKKEELPVPVKASERILHGNWKTQSVRDEFMGLEDGEEGQLMDVWNNFYGRWARVMRSDDKTTDVRIGKLIFVK